MRRARLALHRRIAFGVGLSLPIALLAFRAGYTHPALGTNCCHCSPLYEGGHILLYGALATLAVVSHVPAWRGRLTSAEHHRSRAP